MAGGAVSARLEEPCWVNRWGWQFFCESAINSPWPAAPVGVSWHCGCGDQGVDAGHFREWLRMAGLLLRPPRPRVERWELRLRLAREGSGFSVAHWCDSQAAPRAVSLFPSLQVAGTWSPGQNHHRPP